MLSTPVTVTPTHLTTSTGRFAALYAAPPVHYDTDSCIVLVSGFLGSKEDYLPLLPLLASAGHHAYAYDHRGQHESDGPDDPAAYSIQTLADDLRAVATSVRRHRPPQLVGHCMGGIIARAAVIDDPSAFSTLALLACPLNIPATVAATLSRGATLVRWLGLITLRPLIAQWARSEPGRSTLMEARLHTSKRAHLVGLARALAAATGDLITPLTPTRVPVLVVHGVHDTYLASPAEFESLAQRFGRAAVCLPEAGHNVQIHQPQGTARALLDFWAEQPHATAPLAGFPAS